MSENSKQKRKPVYFSKINAHELELLAHAEQINPLTGKQQNFSEYVKRLIEEDMRRAKNKSNNGNAKEFIIDENLPIINDDESYSIETKKAMSSFL